MKQLIKILSSVQNIKKVVHLFSKSDTEFSYLQCNCHSTNFSKTKIGFFNTDPKVTIIYPDELQPGCTECIREAKTNSKVLFLSNTIDINQMLSCLNAGAEDCFTKETFYLVEKAATELLDPIETK